MSRLHFGLHQDNAERSYCRLSLAAEVEKKGVKKKCLFPLVSNPFALAGG